MKDLYLTRHYAPVGKSRNIPTASPAAENNDNLRGNIFTDTNTNQFYLYYESHKNAYKR